MPTQRSEKFKLYLVIVLAVTGAIVAFFRFVPKGKDVRENVAGSPPQELKLSVQKIKKTRPRRPTATRFPSDEFLNTDVRDILRW